MGTVDLSNHKVRLPSGSNYMLVCYRLISSLSLMSLDEEAA